MTDQSLREQIKEIDKLIETRVMREPTAEDSWIISMRLKLTDAVIDAIIACFKDEGWIEPETKKRKCEDVHPDSEAQHGGH